MARSIASLLLLALLSGCAGYRTVALPGATREQELESKMGLVETGTRVRVTMVSGEERYGRVVSASETEIELVSSSSPAAAGQVIPSFEINSIEVESSSLTREIILFALVAGAVTFGILVHAFAEGMGGLN